jgi:hypothetical protein
MPQPTSLPLLLPVFELMRRFKLLKDLLLHLFTVSSMPPHEPAQIAFVACKFKLLKDSLLITDPAETEPLPQPTSLPLLLPAF